MMRMTYGQAREWLHEVGGTYVVLPDTWQFDSVTVMVPNASGEEPRRVSARVRASLRGRARDEALRAAVIRACEALLVEMFRPRRSDVATQRGPLLG